MIVLAVIIFPLAVWRIADMLSDVGQEGLFNSLDKIRSLAGVKYNQFSEPEYKPGSIAAAIMCTWCSSVWIGLAVTIIAFINIQVAIFVTAPFALSAMAIFIGTLRNYADKT